VEKGLMHGDLYAHNILVPVASSVAENDQEEAISSRSHINFLNGNDFHIFNDVVDDINANNVLLSDFGAASFKTENYFSIDEIKQLEKFEVRAYGCLMEELLSRVVLSDLGDNNNGKLEDASVIVFPSQIQVSFVDKESEKINFLRSVYNELNILKNSCMSSDFTVRPLFSEIFDRLKIIKNSHL
jgi:hypothetical protein